MKKTIYAVVSVLGCVVALGSAISLSNKNNIQPTYAGGTEIFVGTQCLTLGVNEYESTQGGKATLETTEEKYVLTFDNFKNDSLYSASTFNCALYIHNPDKPVEIIIKGSTNLKTDHSYLPLEGKDQSYGIYLLSSAAFDLSINGEGDFAELNACSQPANEVTAGIRLRTSESNRENSSFKMNNLYGSSRGGRAIKSCGLIADSVVELNGKYSTFNISPYYTNDFNDSYSIGMDVYKFIIYGSELYVSGTETTSTSSYGSFGIMSYQGFEIHGGFVSTTGEHFKNGRSIGAYLSHGNFIIDGGQFTAISLDSRKDGDGYSYALYISDPASKVQVKLGAKKLNLIASQSDHAHYKGATNYIIERDQYVYAKGSDDSNPEFGTLIESNPYNPSTDTPYRSLHFKSLPCISFDANGGTGSMDKLGHEVNSAYTLPENGFTAPSGKAFAGWKVGNEGDLLQPGGTINIGTSDVKLFAQWNDIAPDPTPTPDPTPDPTPEPEPTPESGDSPKKGLGAGGVVGIVLGSLVAVCLGAYFVLFFLFNKWIEVDGKAIRVFKFFKKDGKNRVISFKGKVYEKDANNVYRTKDEALKNK